jgi:signal transduction histidine kinase/DNA-binding response OmpR family regulator/HPt (histidine-containing phosphotransfer) domain-containing protein
MLPKIKKLSLFAVSWLLIFNLISASSWTVASSNIKLTEEEQAFIKEHPVIRLGIDPEFVPFEFIDSDGEYKGIAADYIKLINQKTGLNMALESRKTWSQSYEAAVEKKIDVLPSISKTNEREKYFLFSSPYYNFQRVIVVKNENKTIKDIGDLKNIKVAVQKDSSHQSYLKEFPEIELSLYNTVEEALAAVANGTETAFVGNLATSSYIIKSKGFTGLKYIKLSSEEKQNLYFGVRNDWPILVDIINKGLAGITEEERLVIYNKWINVENKIDYGPIIQVAVSICIVIFIVLLVSFFWIAKLKKEVSLRIKTEEDLRRMKQEAENANVIKSAFLARMSHEIRTPLNAITGMAYLIKKTEINLTQKNHLEKIIQASYDMLGIINDILDFSKIEAGKVEIEKISFNLDKVIQKVINIVSFKIEEQDINFNFSKEPEIPVNFIGDPKRIEQILLNIINNAVKFTNEGEVSLKIRLIAFEKDIFHLEFVVKDTGIGMSEQQIKQLFTPFEQGDTSINRRFGGTGLGLSIVKNLVELMDGEINVYSSEGEGSTFIIKLSLEVDKSKELESKKKAASIYLKDIKALVLEKNDILLHIVDKYLTSYGIYAELSTSESYVMKLLESTEEKESKPYDLIIIDYDTPIEGGLEFANNIKDNAKISPKPKIIMLIPLMREDIFEKISNFGIDIGITKPIIPSILYNGLLEIFQVDELCANINVSLSKNIESTKLKKQFHVLIVEDNKTNQIIAKSILEEVGIEVSLSGNGEEGVDYFKLHDREIDLILMDLHMPVLNGYEATQQIRKINPIIPIVAMTADAITGVEDKCKRVGITSYISKPYEPEMFIKTVVELLESDNVEEQIELSQKGEEELHIWSENPPMVKEDMLIIDYADGLKRLGSNQELYDIVLETYLKENQLTSETLKEMIDSQDYQAAAQIVHKVKSSSGNIGAKNFYIIASQLQKTLEEKNTLEIEQLYLKFNNMFTEVLEEINNIIKK